MTAPPAPGLPAAGGGPTGFIILGQRLTRAEIVTIAAVAFAAGGAGWSSRRRG